MAEEVNLCAAASQQIFIKYKNGNIITLHVELYHTMKQIKQMIQNKTNIDIDQITLIFNGKVLMNESKLKEYNIKNESVLHIIIDSSTDAAVPEKHHNYKPLAQMLRKHGYYDDLYPVLTKNDVDLEMLETDLSLNEIDTFCKEFGLSIKQKLKFKKLMRIIKQSTNIDFGIDRAPKRRQEFGRQQSLCIDYKMTMVLVGESGAGKTCLIHKYVNGTFSRKTASTFGVPSDFITVEELANKTVEIRAFDTAGQEIYDSLSRSYYRKADCVVLCYDISKKNSFETLEKWRNKIEEYGDDNVVVIIVGCKKDLAKNDMNIEKVKSIILQYEWQKLKAMHCVCSAKTGHNIRNVFLTAAQLVLNKRIKRKSKQNRYKKRNMVVVRKDNGRELSSSSSSSSELCLYEKREISKQIDGYLDHESLCEAMTAPNDKSKCCSESLSVKWFGKLW